MIKTDKLIFPLVGCDIDKINKKFKLYQIIGTAFSIGNNLFLTASHVIDQMNQYNFSGLIKFEGEDGGELFQIDDYQKIESTDVTLLKISNFDNTGVKFMVWNGNQLNMFDDIFSFGFPFGYNPLNGQVQTRGYKGHVISVTRIEEFKGDYYELSFYCPRGLSGAPLLNQEDGSLVGVIIGNKSTEIEIYRETEESNDGKIRNNYLKYEGIAYGLAMDIESIINVNLTILSNYTLKEYFIETM